MVTFIFVKNKKKTLSFPFSFPSGKGGWRGSVGLSAITGMKGASEGGDTIKQMKEKKFQWEQSGGKREEESGMLFWWSLANCDHQLLINPVWTFPRCTGSCELGDQMFWATIFTSTEMPSYYPHAPRSTLYRLKPSSDHTSSCHL